MLGRLTEVEFTVHHKPGRSPRCFVHIAGTEVVGHGDDPDEAASKALEGLASHDANQAELPFTVAS
jgi:hypothetical protein